MLSRLPPIELASAPERGRFLARSFPPEGNDERIRRLFAESLEADHLGLRPIEQDGVVRFDWPFLMVAASRAAVD